MKAADFGRHVGKTFQKIDRSLDFLPATPRKIAVATAFVASLPIIAGGFFLLVRVPAEVPEPIVEAKSEEVDEALQQVNATGKQSGFNIFDLFLLTKNEEGDIFRLFKNRYGIFSDEDDTPAWAKRDSL